MSQKNCLKRLKNTRFFFVLITSVLSLLLTFLLSDAIYAQTSDRISLQGKIVRNDPGYEGLNVVNGTPACVQSGADTCDFQVRYYSASVSGTLYFTETFSDVEIGDYGGVFNLKLGSGSPTTTTQCADGVCNSVSEVFGEHKAIYMEIGFAPGGAGSFTEVFTRTSLNASAFAMGAGSNSFSFYKKDNAGEANLTATAGAVYYNTTNNKLKVYNGTTWESIGGESLWASENISSWTEGQFLGEGTEGLAQGLSTFSLDPDEGRATINTSAKRGGLSVYSAYTGTDAWSLVSIKGEKSTFNGTLLNLTQDGTGDLIQGHYQSSPTPNFRVDRFGGLHLALDGIGYFEKFLSLPSSASLHPNSNEGCLYSVGSNLYWDPACDASGPVALGAGSTSLWTDSGTYTYLTSVTDDLVLGASTTSGSSFFFDVSAKRLGIGTDTPQASIDIAGSNSTISNTSGNITITPNQNLLLASGKLGIGTASPTASLHIKAGATTAGTAPIKFTAGTNLTTAESGAMEWDGSRLYMTDTTPVRNTIAYTSDFSGSLLPSGTEGQMLYNNAGVWTGYSGMYWDDTYSQLGIGTTSPTATLSVQGSITGGDNAFSTANNNFTFGYDSLHFNAEYVAPNNSVEAIAVQSDGKILIGGQFSTYAGTARQYVARLNSDGSLDTTFNSSSGANNSVYAIAVQSDGKILIGGDFTAYAGKTRQRIARLNSNGSLDTTFNSSSGANGGVYAIAVQSDGKILIGGEFTAYAGTTRQGIARLNSNGSLDTTFDSSSGVDYVVIAIAVQSDGKILIGGQFSTYAGTTRQSVARLNSNGSLDTTFDSSSGANNAVVAIAVQSDGKILIGGWFTAYAGVSVRYLAQIKSDGLIVVEDHIPIVNSIENSFLLAFGRNQFFMDSISSKFQGALTLAENYNDPNSGSIRYNATNNELEFSNDGSRWIALADAIKTATLSAEYPGAVMSADGTNNIGFMTSDAEGATSSSMNYYEWNSSETSLQDYDIRLRFTIPHDFSSWGANAFTLNFATEAATATNNKVDIYVYEENSSTVDSSSMNKYSTVAGAWQTTSLLGADLSNCNAAGKKCLVLIRMYSANDNYVRVGDIDINYNRKL